MKGTKNVSKNHVAMYITGGIAVYKTAQLARLFIKAGFEVRVAMTSAAQKFVNPKTFEVLTNHHVYNDFQATEELEFVPHIALADWTDMAIVVPATANVIAKMSNGLADDFVSTALLATKAQKFVIPAMNENMWQQVVTQRNVQALAEDGIKVMPPATGFLAEGYNGHGRMPEPDDIYQWIVAKNEQKQDLNGINVLITAGPTVEEIDPVRYLTNRSSGKMGYSLAQEAADRGANVTLISGPTKLAHPTNVTVIDIMSAKDLQQKVESKFAQNDFVIMAAAVSDFHVKTIADQKIKKNGKNLQLDLVANPDILAGLGRIKVHQRLVGFAAETQNLLENGNKKLKEKNLDMLVLNDVSRSDIGFNSSENEVRLLQPEKEPKLLKKNTKENIANEILDQLLIL
ncbi:phosphopantothenoylcysteine decarboxylase phosphopantothenate-cysteine ligase [Ligilactobacillus pobuzihii E100301 = KCTC 13174]|uniref:Coenzyme A biosynthesis bifunctional protein CoaBC n=1 Tax=Ligilactobacillus pobuzihii TaxID=449659 RepID=A0A0R2LSL4_9LACO|nr:phosphopantothenoylcysteine decarboxylase phosphopantothenate-cysteine ligase [Ligilactobacillus pobuzihii E100301 = KCTC 13174]KRO02624.1 phosphopantothenoylcysteine decarboxylase phosphopantothenate-cysteine ligase [Ligilactobacillus pobuzihii]